MSDALCVAVPPPREAAVSLRRQRKKALIVEADYLGLTCLDDPGVDFWGPGIAKADTRIPRGITHIWIGRFVDANIRRNLLSQARRRGIVAWDCAIGELLRSKLSSFWRLPHKSLIVGQMTEADTHVTEEIADRFDSRDFRSYDEELVSRGNPLRAMTGEAREFPDLAVDDFVGLEREDESDRPGRGKPNKRDARSSRRMRLLKAAGARYRARRDNREVIPPSDGRLLSKVPPSKAARIVSKARMVVPKPEVARVASVEEYSKATPSEAFLQQLPLLDGRVFRLYCGNGTPSKGVAEIAREIGLPEPNVQRIIARVQAALERGRA